MKISESQKEKADLFLRLHHNKEILVLLNSWDPGSSRLIEASGYGWQAELNQASHYK
jgi:2-methylisocitrate lyase-like PEP mutase family enzyme